MARVGFFFSFYWESDPGVIGRKRNLTTITRVDSCVEPLAVDEYPPAWKPIFGMAGMI